MVERQKIWVVTRQQIVEAFGVAPAAYASFHRLAARPGECLPLRHKERGIVSVVWPWEDIDRLLSRTCGAYTPRVAAELKAVAVQIESRR